MSPIDMTKWKEKYKKGTAAAGKEWYDNFLATSGIADAAKSDAAQELFEEKMRDPDILAKRQKRLAALSDEDFKAPVRAGGASLYTSGTGAKVDKAAKNFEPFAREIDRIVGTLPAPVADPEQNVINRVVPLAVGLHEKAKEV